MMHFFTKNIRFFLSILFAGVISLSLLSQVVRLEPENPSLTETIKIIFNSAEGNGELKDHVGNVYVHTGLITDKSNDIHSWKHVVGEWGQEIDYLKMKSLGNNLYEYEMVIKDFYNIRDEEVVQQIAIVFRNADGTQVGKNKNDEDIVVPVNGYIPPVIIEDNYLFDKRVYQSHKIKNKILIAMQYCNV